MAGIGSITSIRPISQSLRSVPVKVGNTPLPALNELETVDGKIYSNVFLTWDIVRIEPRTGCVEAIAHLDAPAGAHEVEERRHIQSDSNFVLNGIAYEAPREDLLPDRQELDVDLRRPLRDQR